VLSRHARDGFTMVEVIVALVILAVVVLGVSTSAATLTTTAVNAELSATALYSVEDRLARIQLDPRYAALDSLYAGTEIDVLDAPGFNRTTVIDHVLENDPPLDYKVVTVVVEGPLLASPFSRRIIIAAP